MQFITSFTLSLPLVAAKKSYSKAKDASLLSKVRSLTLHQGKETTGRRSSPVPQLNCVGGNACSLYDIDVLRCKNSGSEYDAEDIQWTCQASLPPEFKLGSTEVICEGYDNPDDLYVLKGSCGVEYRLVLTDAGEAKYGRNAFGANQKDSYSGSATDYGGKGLLDTLWSILFWGVFIAIACVILYKIFGPQNPGRGNNPAQGFFGGGGGWPGGGNDDPPPPYTPWSPPRSKPSTSRSTHNPGTSGPGFWSGAATGGAAGYAAGNYMGRREQERAREREREREMRQFGGGNSWLGGGGGGRSGAGSSNSAPVAGPSTTRYESTGFGGTRRR